MDSLGHARGTVFQADDCTIAAVDHDNDAIFVQFIGRWLPNATVKWADTDKNGFSVTRAKSASQATWKAFTRHFDDCRNKRVTVLIFSDRGYAIRGGIPLFTYPSERFQIIRNGVKLDLPFGY